MQSKGRTWRKRQNKTKKPTSISHKQEYIALLQWAKQHSVVFNKMKPAIFPDTGRGLMATRQVNVGDLLISVPERLLVTDQMLRCSYFSGLNSAKRINLTTMDLLCLFLILEQSLGHKSFWYPYISMLPTTFNTPAYFIPQEIAHVPEFFAEQTKSQLKRIEKCFMKLKRLKVKDVELTVDDVRWAWNVVNTRSVYMKEAEYSFDHVKGEAMCYSLAPLLDLLNHSSNAQIDAGFSDTDQCYLIYSKTKFKKGEQVFINYGPHSNRKLLMEYGFILPNNCHNSVKIVSKLVYDIVSKHRGRISKKKCDIITKYNLEDTYFCSLNGLSWSLETALNILCLDDTILEQKPFKIDNLQLSNETNKKLVAKDILKFILDKYDEDIARVWSSSASKGKDSLSERMRQLVTLLEQEMNVVENALVHICK